MMKMVIENCDPLEIKIEILLNPKRIKISGSNIKEDIIVNREEYQKIDRRLK